MKISKLWKWTSNVHPLFSLILFSWNFYFHLSMIPDIILKLIIYNKIYLKKLFILIFRACLTVYCSLFPTRNYWIPNYSLLHTCIQLVFSRIKMIFCRSNNDSYKNFIIARKKCTEIHYNFKAFLRSHEPNSGIFPDTYKFSPIFVL